MDVEDMKKFIKKYILLPDMNDLDYDYNIFDDEDVIRVYKKIRERLKWGD